MSRKPAAYVGYGSVGAARLIEHLRLVCVELQMLAYLEKDSKSTLDRRIAISSCRRLLLAKLIATDKRKSRSADS